MTYTELTALIEQFLETTESSFVANIPNFVRMAEERIHREVQLQSAQKNSTSAFTTSNRYLALPSDFWSPLEMIITASGVSYFLYPKDVSFIRAAYPDPTVTGRPRYYAIFDSETVLVAPTPDSGYVVEFHYNARPESIVDEGTTWLGTNGEQALLYASIIQGYVYLKGDKDVMDMYEARYQEAIARLKIMVEGQNRTDAYRNPEPAINSV